MNLSINLSKKFAETPKTWFWSDKLSSPDSSAIGDFLFRKMQRRIQPRMETRAGDRPMQNSTKHEIKSERRSDLLRKFNWRRKVPKRGSWFHFTKSDWKRTFRMSKWREKWTSDLQRDLRWWKCAIEVEIRIVLRELFLKRCSRAINSVFLLLKP